MTTASADVLFLQLPSPPGRDVLRDFAGGFGLSIPTFRERFGHGGGTVIPHMALVYAFSAAVGLGIDAAFLDAQAHDLDLPVLREQVRGMRPEIIVSSVSLPTMHQDLSVLASLKADTGATIVTSGTVGRILTDDVLGDGTVDVAVTGDLEAVGTRLLPTLLQAGPLDKQAGIARMKAGSIVSTGGGILEDLGVLPLPLFERLPLSKYRNWEFGLAKQLLGHQYGPLQTYFPLYLSRGCPFACDYCPYPVGHGKRHLVKDVEQAVSEFSALAAQGVRHVALRDQVLPIKDGTLVSFCREMKRLDLGISWMCEARVGSLDEPTLRLMREAGCFRIHYGVETGDPRTFAEEAKRGIGPNAVGPCLEATRSAGIAPAAHFLVGFKDDDWGSVQRTVDLIRDLGIGSGDCSILTAYPGTPGYRQAEAEGRLLTRAYEDFTGSNPVTRTNHMSPVEILVARAYILQTIATNRKAGPRRRLAAARKALRQPASVEFGAMSFAERLLAEKPSSTAAVTATPAPAPAADMRTGA